MLACTRRKADKPNNFQSLRDRERDLNLDSPAEGRVDSDTDASANTLE